VHSAAAERLNASLSSFLERAERFAGISAARAETHSAEEFAEGLPHASVEAHSTVEPAGNSSRHNSANASDEDARLLRELRGDALRAVKAGVLGSADPALLMRLLPALHAYVEAGRHVTLSYDEVHTLAMTAPPPICPVLQRLTSHILWYESRGHVLNASSACRTRPTSRYKLSSQHWKRA